MKDETEWKEFKRASQTLIDIDGYVAIENDEFKWIVDMVEGKRNKVERISYEEFTKRYVEKMEPHKNKRVSFDGEGEMFRVFLSQMIIEDWREEQRGDKCD